MPKARLIVAAILLAAGVALGLLLAVRLPHQGATTLQDLPWTDTDGFTCRTSKLDFLALCPANPNYGTGVTP